MVEISQRASKKADPLSRTAPGRFIVTAAILPAQLLYDTVTRFKNRVFTLRRLQDELRDLIASLNLLKEAINPETSVLALLRGPIDQCSRLCGEFKLEAELFHNRGSKERLRDWKKMKFRKGDINDFIDTIGRYKSTILVRLHTITLSTSTPSPQDLEQYTEIILDATHDLRTYLHQINEKIRLYTTKNVDTSDLEGERKATEQCLLICTNASSCLEALSNGHSSWKLIADDSDQMAVGTLFDVKEARANGN